MKRPREQVQVSVSEADVTGDADLYKLLPRALIQANPFPPHKVDCDAVFV